MENGPKAENGQKNGENGPRPEKTWPKNGSKKWDSGSFFYFFHHFWAMFPLFRAVGHFLFLADFSIFGFGPFSILCQVDWLAIQDWIFKREWKPWKGRSCLRMGFIRPRNPRTTPTKSTINIASAKLGVVRILPFPQVPTIRTPPLLPKIPPDKEGLLWGWCVAHGPPF